MPKMAKGDDDLVHVGANGQSYTKGDLALLVELSKDTDNPMTAKQILAQMRSAEGAKKGGASACARALRARGRAESKRVLRTRSASAFTVFAGLIRSPLPCHLDCPSPTSTRAGVMQRSLAGARLPFVKVLYEGRPVFDGKPKELNLGKTSHQLYIRRHDAAAAGIDPCICKSMASASSTRGSFQRNVAFTGLSASFVEDYRHPLTIDQRCALARFSITRVE